MFFGTLGVTGREIDVTLQSERTYRVVAERTGDVCKIELLDVGADTFVGADADLKTTESTNGSEAAK